MPVEDEVLARATTLGAQLAAMPGDVDLRSAARALLLEIWPQIAVRVRRDGCTADGARMLEAASALHIGLGARR